jgi:MOSC domain-containing protein YiiM
MPRLVAVNVGLPREHTWRGRTVRTGVWKEPVVGRRMVRRLNIDGDGQGDLKGHGGEQRAVLVYQLESYRYWERELGRPEFAFGQFGENFTIDGLSDHEVCIGDRYRIGEALLEVSQPRVTCYRIGLRMDEPRMAALLVAHGRPGFYLRVLEEGLVGAGDEIVKIADGAERMTVAEINALLYLPGHRPEDLQRALRIPALSPGWQGSFRALLDHPSDSPLGSGNAGLSAENGPPPAWPGFRTLRVSRIDQESLKVFSLTLTSLDGQALATPLPGQFVYCACTRTRQPRRCCAATPCPVRPQPITIASASSTR